MPRRVLAGSDVFFHKKHPLFRADLRGVIFIVKGVTNVRASPLNMYYRVYFNKINTIVQIEGGGGTDI